VTATSPYEVAVKLSYPNATDNDAKRFGAYAAILKKLSLDVPYVGPFDGDSVVVLSKGFS
jgi:hypothetical protein